MAVTVIDPSATFRKNDALNLAIGRKAYQYVPFHHKEYRTDARQEDIEQRRRGIVGREKIEMECFALFRTTEWGR